MAGNATDYLDQLILDHVFNQGTPAAFPTTFYVELTQTNPTKASAGTKVSGAGYPATRPSIASTGFSRTGSTVDNDATTTSLWGTPTAPWTIEGWEIWDAASGGNRLFWCDDPSLTAAIGADPEFAAGALDITLGPAS